MPKKDIIVEAENLEITDNRLRLDVTSKPSFLRRFFTSNIFTRSLAHLVGRGSKDSKLIRCTEAGELKVAVVGSGYEDNDTKVGNAPDAYAGLQAFDSICSRVDIFVFDNAMMIRRSPDGVRVNDEIEIPANSVFSIDAITASFEVKNETALSVARYSIVGWY